jgi:hypothetical protein
MQTTGLAAIGKPAAMCPSSVKSLDFWFALPRYTHDSVLVGLFVSCRHKHLRAVCGSNQWTLRQMTKLDFESHLVHANDGISCNWEAGRNVPKFSKVTGFLVRTGIYSVLVGLFVSCRHKHLRAVCGSNQWTLRQMTATPVLKLLDLYFCLWECYVAKSARKIRLEEEQRQE